MADAPKTQPTDEDPVAYCAALPTARRREEGARLLELFGEVTGERPVMWGPSIIGFGETAYENRRGSSGTWPRVGFSPRKAALSLHVLQDDACTAELLERLGKHRRAVACLYVNGQKDVDEDVLRDLVAHSWEASAGTGTC